MDELVIDKSKSKLGPLALLAGLFLILGVTMLSTPEHCVNQLWNSLNLIRTLGGLCMVFFWITLFIGVRILTDHTPGLIIDQQGFTSHRGFVRSSDKFSRERIPWRNIAEIKEFKSGKERLVEIEFRDQGNYWDLTKSGEDPGDLEESFSGPPFLLSTKDLSIEFDDLLTQLNHYHQAARTQSKPKI